MDNPYYEGDYAEEIFKDAEKIAVASIGLYDAMQNAEFLGGRAQIYVDIRGIDVNPPTYFGNMSIFQNTASDTTTEDAWQGAYRTIYECNLFLEGIESARENNVITKEEYEFYKGEASFIRGVVYFYVLNFWGQMYVSDSDNLGIPLITKTYAADGPAFTEAPQVKRSSIEDSYKLIEEDLLFAEKYLPETRSEYGGRAVATAKAARAMLTRMYLYRNNNTEVIKYASMLTDQYELASTTVSNLTNPDASSEIIFFIAMNTSDNPNTNNALGQHYGYNRRADITVAPAYKNLFDDSDERKSTVIMEYEGRLYCYKYRNGSSDWAPVIRYAEVLLNHAEALVKSTNTVNIEAIALLNQVHQRSNPSKEYKAADFANATELLEEILVERRRELAFEGHGSFDLFRNQKGIPAGRAAQDAPAINYPNNYFALPIPNSDVIKAGKDVLVQNKGY
ncbi:MAG: RagB/SusD family nutrient uptake outer membrane protein [Tannerellaceae bacterium]|nr:RagB/SusD family nutrient uptake outer membrane protein [Tannerellaceae bacterium]